MRPSGGRPYYIPIKNGGPGKYESIEAYRVASRRDIYRSKRAPIRTKQFKGTLFIICEIMEFDIVVRRELLCQVEITELGLRIFGDGPPDGWVVVYKTAVPSGL